MLAYASEDVAACVPEGESINVSDLADDFTRIRMEAHKVVSLVKVANAFVTDNAFDIRKHLTKRFAKVFGRAEENLFINGIGEGLPVGILKDTLGAVTGVTTTDVTFDDVINLFMSVKAKHRMHGVWLMNDETALAIRKLKDKDGNFTVQRVLAKETFGKKTTRSVKTSDAKLSLIKLQQEDKKSYSSIHTIRGVLRPAFQMAVDDDIIVRNPFEFQLDGVLVNDSVTREGKSWRSTVPLLQSRIFVCILRKIRPSAVIF